LYWERERAFHQVGNKPVFHFQAAFICKKEAFSNIIDTIQKSDIQKSMKGWFFVISVHQANYTNFIEHLLCGVLVKGMSKSNNVDQWRKGFSFWFGHFNWTREKKTIKVIRYLIMNAKTIELGVNAEGGPDDLDVYLQYFNTFLPKKVM
jgi:hypothetical protein